MNNIVNLPALKQFIYEEGAALPKPWFGQFMNGPQLLAYLIQMNVWLREYGVKIIAS